MIFSRGKGAGRRGGRGTGESGADLAAGRDPLADLDTDLDTDTAAGADPDDGAGTGADGVGPYDITEAPESDAQMLDLGGMLIPVREGIEIRVEADPEGDIRSVVLAHRNGGLELSVFAAPRTDGIWDEVRDEIRTSLEADKATTSEVDGPYGTELRARVRTPGGPLDVRFVGVDGPRWMVRAVYQGKAATDPAAAAPLDECLHGLVVNRGTAAMPVRDAIPLRLPRQAMEDLASSADTPPAASSDPSSAANGTP